MKHNRTIRAARCPAFQAGYLAVALALCLLFLGCDDDPPTGPVQPKDYVVYFWDATSDRDFFGYHPLTGAIDTLAVDYYPLYGVTVAADGERLYCCTGTLIGVVDPASSEIITELPYTAHGFAVSPDNRLIAILDSGLVILNVPDYTPVYVDSALGNYWCTFSFDSRTLYCWGGTDRFSVVRVRLDEAHSIDTIRFSDDFGIMNFLPSVDDNRWFLYRHGRYTAVFEVYDALTDAIVFRNYLGDTYGAMRLTPDGRYLFYTELGNQLDYDGPPYFTVYDIARNRIKMQMSTVGIIDGINPEYMSLGGAALTPDGRWLVLGSKNLPALLVFDIEQMIVTEYVDLTDNWVASPTCQLIP